MNTDHPYTSTTTHWGDMRCHTIYTDRTAECTTDIPQALGGYGEYPSPGEMLAACVASCMLSMVAYTGRTKGFDTSGISIRARASEENGEISGLYFDIHVPVQTTPEARRFMQAAVHACPVGGATKSVPKDIAWRWQEDDA